MQITFIQGLNRYANFVNADNPWFKRGGNYNNGANAGTFNFNNNNGNANNNNGFRSVLSFVTTIYKI